jgi:hypothetical protein
MDEESDPEACYRRGYEHGAEEVFRAVAAALPQSLCSMIERWLESDVKTCGGLLTYAGWIQLVNTRHILIRTPSRRIRRSHSGIRIGLRD